MNKKTLLVIAIFGTVVIGALSWRIYQMTARPVAKSKQSASLANKPMSACDILSLDDAKKILGDNPRQSVPQEAQQDSSIVSVSACGYASTAVVDQTQTTRSIGITVRSPINDDGIKANNALAKSNITTATKVEGYDETYWMPSFNQLMILRESTILFVYTTTGSIPLSSLTGAVDVKNPTSYKATPGTLDEAKKVADIIKDKI